MKADVYIKINKDYFVDGYIHYKGVDTDKHWIMYNQGYDLYLDDIIISKSEIVNKNLCVKKSMIQHHGSFSLRFKGYIDVPKNSSFVKKEHYLEVSGNCGVIPLIAKYPRCNFTVYADIPNNYCLAGFNKTDSHLYKLYVEDNYHIAIIMFKRKTIQIYTKEKTTIYAGLYHDPKRIQMMADICNNILKTYENLFSPTKFSNLYLILNPRFENGAYAVNNIVSLVDNIEGLDQKTFMHIAHEISHLWWKNGMLNNHDNWLNETFAQYSALLLVRDKYGIHAYQNIVDKFQIDTKDLPSLSSINDNTSRDIWFPIIYNKGPYLFTKLEEKIGYKNMITILRETYLKKISTTEEFLNLCPEFIEYYNC